MVGLVWGTIGFVAGAVLAWLYAQRLVTTAKSELELVKAHLASRIARL